MNTAKKKISRERMLSVIKDTKEFCYKWGLKTEASRLGDEHIENKDYDSLYEIFENAINILLSSDVYKKNMSDVSEKAWEYIFLHTGLISEYTMDKYNVSSCDDILQALMVGEFEENFGINPLDFEEWEEVLKKLVDINSWSLELVDKGGYCEYKDGRVILSPEIVEPIWNMMEEEAKQYYRKCLYKLDYNSKIVERIRQEIKDILEE